MSFAEDEVCFDRVDSLRLIVFIPRGQQDQSSNFARRLKTMGQNPATSTPNLLKLRAKGTFSTKAVQVPDVTAGDPISGITAYSC